MALYTGKYALNFRGNRIGTRPTRRALYTGKCVLKTSGGIGNGIDLLIWRSIQGNVH